MQGYPLNPASKFALRMWAILAFCLACSGGCGPRYEMPEPPPRDHAARDTFTIRSLTVNGREIADGHAGQVMADQPLEVKGEIDFRKGRPHPPLVLVQFVDESGDRPVTHGSAIGRLGTPSRRGTPFTVSEEAPTRPGTYTLRLLAMPPKPNRKESGSGGGRQHQIYAESELTVMDRE